MREYARRLVWALALVAGAVVLASLGRVGFELAEDLIDWLGPWSLVVIGFVTLALGAVWVRYGASGALKRWGVTIKPAQPDLSAHDAAPGTDRGADADLGGAAGRRGPRGR